MSTSSTMSASDMSASDMSASDMSASDTSATATSLTDTSATPDVPADLPAVIGSLSPSRASDFKTCPLLYRLRSIDRLPEPPSAAATRGTVVHAVLERLFDLPSADRTLATARAAVAPAWQTLLAAEPELAALFADDVDGSQTERWLESARALVDNYFRIEDPTRLEPFAREQLVEYVSDGLRLRGYVDRIDVSPAGDVRIVDYKTGSIPREAYEAKALFQMKFYALVLWRTRGTVPRQLRLMYLSDVDTLSYEPDPDELVRFERTLQAIWKAIESATTKKDFRASPSRLCDWCAHQSLCPAKGGTPPPFPDLTPGPASDQVASPATHVEAEL